MADKDYNKLPDSENPENTENKEVKKDGWSTNAKIVYIIIVTIAVFVGEHFIRGPLTAFSDAGQEKLIDMPYKCELATHFVWFKYQGKSFIFLVLFNMSNIFVSLSMITLDAASIFINGTFKLFYTDPRPFWRNHLLEPCTCALNYGSPSTTGLDVYIYSLVVFKGFINRSNKRWYKVLIWILFLGPIVLAWASRFMQNVHSLHQLAFGTAIGYIIQYIYYEIMEVDMNSKEQLKKLVNNTWLLATIGITIFSWFFFNGLHYYFFQIKESREILDRVELFCSDALKREYDIFDNESYQKTSQAFLFIGALIGIMLEYNVWFKGDYEAYAKYNMDEERWTETDIYKTALRCIVMYFVGHAILSIPKWGSKKKDPIIELMFSKNIVANIFKGVFYFLLIKVVFYLLTISNESSGVNYNPKEISKNNGDVELNESLIKKDEKKPEIDFRKKV